MGEFAISADGEPHCAQAVQQVARAEIKRCVLAQRCHCGIEHGLDQGLMMRSRVCAEIADAQHGVARGGWRVAKGRPRQRAEIGGQVGGDGLNSAKVQ